MNGVAITTSSEVVKFAHTSSGMRQNVMPGARIVMIVTRKFSAVAIDDAPANCTPSVKNCWPERRVGRERGVGGPAGGEGAARGEERASIITPAIGSIQNDSAFRRGNAMSGAPIISGIT